MAVGVPLGVDFGVPLGVGIVDLSLLDLVRSLSVGTTGVLPSSGFFEN